MSNKIRSMAKARQRKQEQAGMTITLGQLLRSTQALNELVSQPIPICTSHLINKVIFAVNQEIEQYEASRKTLCARYANKDNDGKPVLLDEDNNLVAEDQPGRFDIPKEAMPEFEKESADLVSVEVQIPGRQFKLSELSAVKMAPALLRTLEWLIVE